MTTARLTKRRTTLEKNQPAVIAALVDGNTHAEVARQFKVSREAVAKFQDRHLDEIERLKREIAVQVEQAIIADKVRRVLAADDEHTRLGRVIEARASDGRYDEPGYDTGMMVHKLKVIGAGKSQQLVDEYEVDTALVAERRALREYVAKELDQWPRGTGASTAIGVEVVIRTLIGVRDEDIR